MTDLLTREEINNLGVVLFKPSEAEGEMAKRLKEQAASALEIYDRAIEDAAQKIEQDGHDCAGTLEYVALVRSLKGSQNG